MAGFRGPTPYADVSASFGVGGNQVMDASTGTVPGSVGAWHPTILYLFGLLVVEWLLLVFVSRYV